jgi:hypothetical protein
MQRGSRVPFHAPPIPNTHKTVGRKEESMTFIEYLTSWINKYPQLDVYYHLVFIEQAYQEYKEEQSC